MAHAVLIFLKHEKWIQLQYVSGGNDETRSPSIKKIIQSVHDSYFKKSLFFLYSTYYEKCANKSNFGIVNKLSYYSILFFFHFL